MIDIYSESWTRHAVPSGWKSDPTTILSLHEVIESNYQFIKQSSSLQSFLYADRQVSLSHFCGSPTTADNALVFFCLPIVVITGRRNNTQTSLHLFFGDYQRDTLLAKTYNLRLDLST